MTTEMQENSERIGLTALLDGSAAQTPMADRVPDSAFREIVRGARWEIKRSRRVAPDRGILQGYSASSGQLDIGAVRLALAHLNEQPG
jgi:hypothetical protein